MVILSIEEEIGKVDLENVVDEFASFNPGLHSFPFALGSNSVLHMALK
jgi:hypothetical protein